MARTSFAYALLFAGLLMQVSRAEAAAGPTDRDRQTVATCVVLVRAQDKYGLSQFDAYLAGDAGETLRYIGTAVEKFQFEKCLNERGLVSFSPVKP